jgi:hypothetical protein
MERAYWRGLALVYQSDSIDATIVAAGLVEGDLIEGVEVTVDN